MKNWIKKLLPVLSRQLIPNLGTVLAVAALLFAYNAWAAPGAPPDIVTAPLAGPAAQGSTPGTLSYQGYLTNAAGQPINGTLSITFRMYNVPSGGTALWTEEHTGANAVPVSKGLFNVHLGSLSSIPPSVWSSPTLYLGIQVGSDAEMSPREVVGAVPVAKVAEKALDTALVTSSSENTWMQSGSVGVEATTATSILSVYIDYVDYPSRPLLFVLPAYNYTPWVVATYGLPCDNTGCTAFLARTDGGLWAPGQGISMDWLAVGTR